ncbi:hypothetical protein KA005_74280, partial [bacterium]|nr:hypothetical protein [bacterium]
IEDLYKIHEEYEAIRLGKPSPTLKHPFDYLSCEQIGDSFNLLRNLYSLEFLGNKDLIERTNTVLTGPRGCGKTTIFRNMSLKAQLLSGALETVAQLDDWAGIYYSCKDLYYAFPYMRGELDRTDLEVTLHYFNLAILVAIVDTLMISHTKLAEISEEALSHIEGFVKAEIPDYVIPPIDQSTYRLRHLFDSVLREKMNFKTWLEQRESPNPIRKYLGLDFVPRFCNLLRETIPWLKNRPIYLFLDDYSLPKVSAPLQRSINRVVFDRSENCYFKISTESVTTIEPYDADGKLLEEAREYDLIDLGDYFLFANQEDRYKFLTGIINNRLRQSEGIHRSYHDIAKILGNTPYSNNKIARDIVAKKRVYYHGIGTFVDLCSGDISHMLRLARDIFAQVGGPGHFRKPRGKLVPVPADKQNRAIRRFGASFLNQLETITGTGPHLRRIVEAFGEVAHFQLCNMKSKNLKNNPPKQAFRIEMRSRPEFQDPNVSGLYSNLLRYGAFIRDVRGKSQRGVVVPRLYLRRILIPTFRLTFSQRDNVGMEADEFLYLLREPS